MIQFTEPQLKTYIQNLKPKITKELNISRQAVDNWFKGRTKPCKKHMIALATILDVPVEEVLERLKRTDLSTESLQE